MSEPLTVGLVNKLAKKTPAPPQGKRIRLYDSSFRGLAAVKLPSGRVVFTLEYGPRKRRRRVTLGHLGKITLEDARKRAKIQAGEIEKGSDPVAEKAARRAAVTFAAWRESYVEMVKERKKTWRDDKRYLGRAGVWWDHKLLLAITTEDVEKAFQQTRKARGKVSANRFLASVRACLQQAWRLSKVVENVAAKVSFLPENPPRSRVLSDEELQAVVQALAEIEDPWDRAAITLIIETGARKSEALRAKWEDFDLQARTWRIPSPKAGHPQLVPLAGSTVALLRNLSHRGDWVFPGRHSGKHRADVRDVWARVREAAEVPDVTVHDLRRSFGLQVARTAGLHVASRLLRHARVTTTAAIYAPLGLDELRKATEKVSRDRGKVLAMPARKARK
jgi:integrase